MTLADENAAGAHLMRHAGGVTAAQRTHAYFVEALEGFWRDGPGVLPGL